MQKLLLSYFFL